MHVFTKGLIHLTLMPGEAVACRRPGALLNKLEAAWLEGVWLGRASKTDEHLIGAPNGLVHSRALKRRVDGQALGYCVVGSHEVGPLA